MELNGGVVLKDGDGALGLKLDVIRETEGSLFPRYIMVLFKLELGPSSMPLSGTPSTSGLFLVSLPRSIKTYSPFLLTGLLISGGFSFDLKVCRGIVSFFSFVAGGCTLTGGDLMASYNLS